MHLTTADDGLTAYVRFSFPLVVAEQLKRPEGATTARYTTARVIDGTVMNFIDAAAVERGIMDLAERVTATDQVGIDDGRTPPGEPVAARASLRGAVVPFNSLEQARAALNGPAYPNHDSAVEISSAMLEVAIR